VKGSLILLLSCIAVTQLTFGAESVSAQKIDDIFAGLKSDNAPGAGVLVVKDGKPVYQQGYGVTDLRTRKKINEQTNFRLASVSKQFTAMAVMLLVHDGKLHYEDRLTKIFPDFAAYGNTITIRNLLNHTSGLLDYEDLMRKPYGSTRRGDIRQIQDSEVLALLKKQKRTKFAPGSRWDYSNSGYVVFGQIVEEVSGESFGDFLHDRIFAPLGMNHTVAYQRGKNEVANRAYGHTKENGAWQETDQSSTSATLGDGGIYSSLTDLAKWDAALRQHMLLSETEMQPALTPVHVPGVQEPDGKPAAYGFGWFLNPYKGHHRMWHYGETVGFRTTIQRFPDDNLTIIILCNRAGVVPKDLALKVADLFLERAADSPLM
jgi:CubicO group peptidase (beta-lactamase class C family)